MSSFSLGDLSQTFLLQRRSVSLRQDLSKLTGELSTGKVADVREVLAGNHNYLSSLERSLSTLDAYSVSNSESAYFTAAMQTSLNRVQDFSGQLGIDLILASSGPVGVVAGSPSENAMTQLEGMVNSLNSDIAGKALFSGTTTDRVPLADPEVLLAELLTAVSGQTTPQDIANAAQAWFDDPAGFDALVYSGSDTALAPFVLSETERVSLDVRANDPALKTVLMNTALAALADDPTLALSVTDQSELFGIAGLALQSNQDQLTDLRSKIGLTEARIEMISVRNQAEETSVEFARNALLSADPFETATDARKRAISTTGSLLRNGAKLAAFISEFPMKFLVKAIVVILWSVSAAVAGPVRIKDLVEFDGVRGNDLVGYGLVVGLNGSGDGLRNSPFTEEIMTNILERLGVNVTGEQFRPKNVAAVLVTAALPPFARGGSQIDVTVSAIGDAKSLLGGTLIMTPMNAADGQIYAVAQGTIIAGGAVAEGDGAKVTTGVPTAGVIPSGARVEREIEFDLSSLTEVRLALRNADFTTAARIEEAINNDFGRDVAFMVDSGTVQLDVVDTRMRSVAHALGRIENISVEPERKARVVVDQRSGTIVMGDDVRISRVAVSQGNLTLRIQEAPLAVQPNPFSEGETVIVPRTQAELEEEPGIGLAEIPEGTSLSEVIAGLNALGVSPRDMIDILKSIKAAGALHAEFLVR